MSTNTVFNWEEVSEMTLRGCLCAVLMLLLIMLATFVGSITIYEAEASGVSEPLISMMPSSLCLERDEPFWISVLLSNVTDLYAWQFEIRFEIGIFDAIEVDYTPNTILADKVSILGEPTIHNESGRLSCGSTLIGDESTFNGSGILAKVKFIANIPGNWTFRFDDAHTFIMDNNLDMIQYTMNQTEAIVKPFPVPKATLRMKPPCINITSLALVNQTYDFIVDVDVFNVFGLYSGQIGIFYNGSVLEFLVPTSMLTKLLYLNYAGYVLLSSVNPIGRWADGNVTLHSLKFRVVGVGQTSLDIDLPNTKLWLPNKSEVEYEVGGVTVVNVENARSLPEDITGPDGKPDGIVDMKDVSVAGKAFGSFPGYPRWNPNADVNQDGTIDMKDMCRICRNFGKTSP